ncbi:lymphocyte antigen 6D-like isoform X1 [Lathamus discolor]|uniref:lymphocyte antigen 6D-like isoform X1 n=1 Tax=Lathamus discolor TaxID=678569 RepID=UPI0032B7BC22
MCPEHLQMFSNASLWRVHAQLGCCKWQERAYSEWPRSRKGASVGDGAGPHSRAQPGQALRCHKCVASNENDCNKQGSHSCPQYADACSTITAPNSIIKSCSYKAFCDQARGSGSSGATLRCCFSDDCNGQRGPKNGAGIPSKPPHGLLVAALAGMLLLSWL